MKIGTLDYELSIPHDELDFSSNDSIIDYDCIFWDVSETTIGYKYWLASDDNKNEYYRQGSVNDLVEVMVFANNSLKLSLS